MLRPTLLVLAGLALPVLAPSGPRTAVHGETRADLGDVNLAAAVANAQAQSGGEDGLGEAWCGDALDVRRHRARRLPRGRARRSRSSTRTPPTAPTASPAGPTRSRPTSRSSSASCRRRAAGRRRSASTWARAAGRSTWTSRPSRCRGRTRATPATSARSPARSQARDRRRRPAQRDHPRRRAVDHRATSYGLAETIMGADGERPGADEPAQPRRAQRRAVQPRRRRAARPPAPRLVAGGLPARDHAHARRRAVGRAALHPAARASRTRATATAGRARTSCVTPRTPAPPSSCRSTAAGRGRDHRELRLRPRRLLQPGAAAGQLSGHALEHVRLGVPGALRGDRAGVRRRRHSDRDAAAAGRDRRARRSRARAAAARRCGPRPGTGSTGRPLRVPVAAPVRAHLAQRSRRRPTRATSPATRDLGRRLRVIVTATNADGVDRGRRRRRPRPSAPRHPAHGRRARSAGADREDRRKAGRR